MVLGKARQLHTPMHTCEPRSHFRDLGSPALQDFACDVTFGKARKVTAIMVADIGTFSEVAEGAFYAANLRDATTISAGKTLCAARCWIAPACHRIL